MLFGAVTGQTELKLRLTQMVRERRIAHAHLLWGSEGSGALPLALALAQYIMCPNRTDTDACGVCPSCNKVQKLIHPDLHFVLPVNSTKEITSDKKPVTEHFMAEWREALLANPYITEQEWYETMGIENKQGNINVHEASRIIEKLNYKPFEAEYKIMIIWLPERMNTAAANKLLKLIEEPPSKTLFFLVSGDTTRIIKTILSRAQPVRVPPIDEDALVQAALAHQGVNDTQAHKLARAAAGSYSELQKLLANEQSSGDHLERFSTLMRTAYAADGLALMAWAEETAQYGREQQKAFLLYTESLLRESFMFNRNVSEATYLLGDEEAFAKKIAPFINERNIDDIYKTINLTMAHLSQNGNAKIIFTDLALQLAVLLRK